MSVSYTINGIGFGKFEFYKRLNKALTERVDGYFKTWLEQIGYKPSDDMDYSMLKSGTLKSDLEEAYDNVEAGFTVDVMGDHFKK